jgi:valyl-tRNA synthetase
MLANKNKLNILLGVSLVALSLASISVSQAGLYRWVDGSGKVHFSDKIPPSSSQKGHSELSKDGIEKKKVLSADELRQIKSEAEKTAAENQQLALEKEKQRLAQAERRKHDAYLLSTFDSKDELIHYYEGKITTLSETANILIARNNDLTKKAQKVRTKKTAAKTKNMRASLAKALTRLEKSISQYEKALNENKLEVTRLKNQYQKDLQRYAELSPLTSSL